MLPILPFAESSATPPLHQNPIRPCLLPTPFQPSFFSLTLKPPHLQFFLSFLLLTNFLSSPRFTPPYQDPLYLTKIPSSHQFHKFQRGSPSIKNFITIKFG
ncbi:hypothetical protein RchiOBHm_Chr5g0053051 [Rosa chinensis]|uniref:Uncharacterized protein n=1 Tax=Rosa chinensis TaxID=74649 RepID=A0A2P6QFT0_ROSCH|nr:hypothetical protein RchiOBHm_Chr5g0053051 [Rosa chinensis]